MDRDGEDFRGIEAIHAVSKIAPRIVEFSTPLSLCVGWCKKVNGVKRSADVGGDTPLLWVLRDGRNFLQAAAAGGGFMLSLGLPVKDRDAMAPSRPTPSPASIVAAESC